MPLATLLAESDWIVPQLPTAPATRNLLGRAELAQIKPGACIVNVANAPIINRDAVIEALRAGRLGGFALDVHYAGAVADDDELLGFDNVMLTPRMAGSPRFNGLNDFEELITAWRGSWLHDPHGCAPAAMHRRAGPAPAHRAIRSIRTGRSG